MVKFDSNYLSHKRTQRTSAFSSRLMGSAVVTDTSETEEIFLECF